MGDLRLITSAYPGKCRVCRTPYDRGDQVWWRKGEKGVVCGQCKANAKPDPVTAEPVPAAPEPTTTNHGNRTIRRYDSWQDYVAKAEASKDPNRQSCMTGRDNAKFSGSRDWDSAIKLAKTGWAEIRPEVDALVHEIDDKVSVRLQPAFSSVFDVAGGSVDVGRFLDGEPECMVETKLVEVAKPGRVISVLINGVVNAVVGIEQIKKRGAAIVALIDTLERLQHATEIFLEISIQQDYTVLVKLKGANEVLDIDNLMFAIAHPSTLRRLFFAHIEGETIDKVRELSNYGSAMRELICGQDVDASLELTGMTPEGDAEKWILKTLSKFGLVREDGK